MDPGLFTYKEVFFPSWFWLSLYKQDFVFKTPQLSTSLYPSGGLPIIAQWTQIITIIIIIIAHVKRPTSTDGRCLLLVRCTLCRKSKTINETSLPAFEPREKDKTFHFSAKDNLFIKGFANATVGRQKRTKNTTHSGTPLA